MDDKFAMLQSYKALCEGLVSRESLAVLASSRGGIACSARPASMTAGSCVNPQLGAMVLVGKEDLDFALPGALPVIWQRQYSSRVNPEHGVACGLLGHGWHLPTEISLELQTGSVLLFDAAGRVITFYQSLEPGGQCYSTSEDLWLLRGGKDGHGYPPGWSRQQRFAHVNAELAGDEHSIFISSGTTGALWVFTPAPVTEDAAGKTPGETEHDAHPAAPHNHAHGAAEHHHDTPNTPPVGQRWRLAMQVDRFGRSQRYRYSQGSESDRRYAWPDGDEILPVGSMIGLTDGVGRRYRLYHQRIHTGKLAQGLWGADTGWRLAGVELEHDPNYFTPAPILLVRYGYDRQGQLVTVHDRAGELAREFEWLSHRVSGHCHRGGPWHFYRYEGVEPDLKVIEHANVQGLSYRFEYQHLPPSPEGKPAKKTIITDSLMRTETYCFEGLAGLNRPTEHHKADGTVMRYRHDSHGRLIASIDPLERNTSIRYNLQGNIVGVQQERRLHSRNYDQAGRLTASYDPTGAVIRYQYDDAGRLTQIARADQSVEHHHYPDPKDQPSTCDRPARIEDASGRTSHLQYNDAGQLVSHTDSSGHTTLWDYDRWGDVIEETDCLGNLTRYERDAAGHIIAAHLPTGQTRRYQYDRQGNLTRIEPDESAPDSVLNIGRDLWGRVVKTSLGGLTLQMSWDEAGRLITLTNENGVQSQFVWDAMDRLVQETGFDGRIQRHQWDAAGQLIQTSEGSAGQAQMQPDQVQTSHYSWSETGLLIERQLPATQASDRQSQRYEWDLAGRLKTACVYLITQQQEQTHEQLQSRVEIERDILGRITGELQQLYQAQDTPTAAPPPVEYEHRIIHQLDPSGNQRASELQNTGQIQWLFDNSGQVNSLVHDGRNLIDFERNALHQEIRRQWHTLPATESTENLAPALLTQIRRWDSLGRLQDTKLDALSPQAIGATPPLLADQITHRRYLYDALGQLIALQTPAQTLRYGYDAAGRLRVQADSQTPPTTQRWDIDPAGNRLPGQAPSQQQDWAELVHWRWKDPSFNPFAQNAAAPERKQDPIDKWPNNRIGFHQGSAWRYDAQGNRLEEIRQAPGEHYDRKRLSYDGSNQLTALHLESVDTQGNVTVLSESRYIYDALGRRLKKTVRNHQREQILYYGWDGDRLVRTEQMKEDGTRDIAHTIYEPNSLTPLIRLCATAKGLPQAKPHLIAQAIKASVPADKRNMPGIELALTMVQDMLAGMPERMQKKLEESMQQIIQPGPAGPGQPVMPGSNMARQTSDLIATTRKRMDESIQKIRQHSLTSQGHTLLPGNYMAGQTGNPIGDIRAGLKETAQEDLLPVTVQYYHCDQLGTPLALTDQYGRIIWAARLDPWGNIEEEFNSQDVDQPIRLPGQYHDRETGLYYSQGRYYDPQVCAYITQNSAGMKGGINGYRYALNPATGTDPLGLWHLPSLLENIASDMAKPEDMATLNPARVIKRSCCFDHVDAKLNTYLEAHILWIIYATTPPGTLK
jgi:RHS repeat-associated protein